MSAVVYAVPADDMLTVRRSGVESQAAASRKDNSHPDDIRGYKRVLRVIAELIAETAASPQQWALLGSVVVGLDRCISAPSQCGDVVPSIDLPLAVHAAITGEEDTAVPLAAACALVCFSIGLFDDLADDDRRGHWARHSVGEINLAAATVLSALPSLILARLDVAPPRRVRLQQILAEGLLRVSAGQQADLALTGAHEVTVGQVEAAVVGKIGERFATYCKLAAEMAAATTEAMSLYEAFGREIGIARQLISDCHDLVSRDLVHGTRTMPIVAHINRLSESDRQRFLDLLDHSRTDRHAAELVRRELRESGEISRVIFRARLHYGRARAIIDRVDAREPGRARLLCVARPGFAAPTGASGARAGNDFGGFPQVNRHAQRGQTVPLRSIQTQAH
jgi:geranylgeranyl pyrophosphate synthase